MDGVEIILRTEELFAITIDDDEASAVRTVGDFYRLICAKLEVEPLPAPVTPEELPVITHKQTRFLILGKHTPLPAPPELLPWSPQTVWSALVAIFVDQQALKPEKVQYHAEIARDLGVD